MQTKVSKKKLEKFYAERGRLRSKRNLVEKKISELEEKRKLLFLDTKTNTEIYDKYIFNLEEWQKVLIVIKNKIALLEKQYER